MRARSRKNVCDAVWSSPGAPSTRRTRTARTTSSAISRRSSAGTRSPSGAALAHRIERLVRVARVARPVGLAEVGQDVDELLHAERLLARALLGRERRLDRLRYGEARVRRQPGVDAMRELLGAAAARLGA